MNICFIVYNCMIPGGLNSVVKSLVNELSKEPGFSISILDLNPEEPLHKNELSESVRYAPLKPTRYRYPLQFWFNLRPVFYFLKNNKIDIALVEGTDTGLFVPPLQPILKTKLIFCDHGALCNQLENRKVTFIRYIASKLCAHTIVLTEKNFNDYKHLFNIKEEKLSIIYNYVECPVTRYYNAESKRILTIGRLTSEKGMNLLISVANIVLKSYPSWTWDVYGDGPMLPELLAKTKELGIENSLHFLGNVDNAAQYMSQYSIYVLPSYREGLPLVLIEALTNALPMVSFDIDTGPRDIIKDDQTGFLIEPYNIEQMAMKLESLMESQELRSRFSENCYHQIFKFDKLEILRKWKHLILSVYSEKRL